MLGEALGEALPLTREQREYVSLAYFDPKYYLKEYHPHHSDLEDMAG